jgi:hypothetical protein
VILDRVVIRQAERKLPTDLAVEIMDTPALATVLMVNAAPSMAGGESFL